MWSGRFLGSITPPVLFMFVQLQRMSRSLLDVYASFFSSINHLIPELHKFRCQSLRFIVSIVEKSVRSFSSTVSN